jgi:hypothetical protein
MEYPGILFPNTAEPRGWCERGLQSSLRWLSLRAERNLFAHQLTRAASSVAWLVEKA